VPFAGGSRLARADCIVLFAVWFAAASCYISALLAVGIECILVAVRWALCLAIAHSYDTTGASGKWLFWLSPLADSLAFLRILISALNQPTQWRGRKYQ
jgi:hypothetical protein